MWSLQSTWQLDNQWQQLFLAVAVSVIKLMLSAAESHLNTNCHPPCGLEQVPQFFWGLDSSLEVETIIMLLIASNRVGVSIKWDNAKCLAHCKHFINVNYCHINARWNIINSIKEIKSMWQFWGEGNTIWVEGGGKQKVVEFSETIERLL